MFFPDALDTVLTELLGFHHEDIRLSFSAEHQVFIATYSLPIRSQAVPELSHSVDSPSSSSDHEKCAIGVTKHSGKASEKEHLQETRSFNTGSLTIVVRGLTRSQDCQTRPLLSPRRSLAALSGSSHSSATKSIQASEKTLGGLESDKESQGNVRTTSQPPVQRHNEPPVGDCKTKGPPKSDVTSNRRQNPTSQSEAFLHQNSNTDCVDECAIDDDSEWKDSIENDNTSSVDETGKRSSIDEETFFQRTGNNSKLTSRRSLITMMVVEMDNRGGVGTVASRSISTLPFRTNHPAPPTLAVSPNDSDDAPLIMKRDNGWPSLKPITEVPRFAPRPISKSASRWCESVLSPRTTRRNMLATEWPDSLRSNVLWERQQKLITANAVLKRHCSSHDIANLKQYPKSTWTTTKEDSVITSLYFKDVHLKGMVTCMVARWELWSHYGDKIRIIIRFARLRMGPRRPYCTETRIDLRNKLKERWIHDNAAGFHGHIYIYKNDNLPMCSRSPDPMIWLQPATSALGISSDRPQSL
ncbi:hypothetical protein CABS03_15026 [Colletotrichum abscissum]